MCLPPLLTASSVIHQVLGAAMVPHPSGEGGGGSEVLNRFLVSPLLFLDPLVTT